MIDLRIAIIQTDLHWEDISANLAMLDEKVRAVTEEVDLIALPEMFSTGFSMSVERLAEPMNGSAVQWLQQAAKLKNCVIAGSLMLYDEKDGVKNYYNRLVWMKPDGKYETYDKRHLFSLSSEPKEYTAGEKRLIANINGWNICPMICYDLRFPVWSRNAINDKRETSYDVLLYSANWPDRRATAWKTLLQARAIENQCYVVAVNRTGLDGKLISHKGDSMVIDPLGEILYHKEYEEDIYTIHLHKNHLEQIREKFPFWKDADQFNITHE